MKDKKPAPTKPEADPESIEGAKPYSVKNSAVGPRGFSHGPKAAHQVTVAPGATVKVFMTDEDALRHCAHPDLAIEPADSTAEGDAEV